MPTGILFAYQYSTAEHIKNFLLISNLWILVCYFAMVQQTLSTAFIHAKEVTIRGCWVSAEHIKNFLLISNLWILVCYFAMVQQTLSTAFIHAKEVTIRGCWVSMRYKMPANIK